MKLLNTLILLFFWLGAGSVQAYTCEKPCTQQCSKNDFFCLAACKSSEAITCWDLSNPALGILGEAGAFGYREARDITLSMNLDKPQRNLTEEEKGLLKRYFSQTILDNARLYFKSRLVEKWGRGPYAISFYESEAQTFGYDIFFTKEESVYTRNSFLATLAHELIHTQQFENRGRDLSRFGRDYFEGFFAGLDYDNNPMEREAFDFERSFATQLAVAHIPIRDTPWDLEVCNKTENESLSVAVAYIETPNGFSLIPRYVSRGWYIIKRWQCQLVATGLSRGNPVWYYATTDVWNEGAVEWTGRDRFCLRRDNTFDYKGFSDCPEMKGFRPVIEPFEDQVLRSLAIEGPRPTRIEFCNRYSETIEFSTFRFFQTSSDSGWRHVGPYVLVPNECREIRLGRSNIPIWTYARNIRKTLEWTNPNEIDTSCFYSTPFSVPDSMKCVGGDKIRFHKGVRVVQGGLVTHSFFPDEATPMPIPEVVCSKLQFKIDNRCFDIAGDCSQFNGTRDDLCATQEDSKQCTWSALSQRCYEKGPTDRVVYQGTYQAGSDAGAQYSFAYEAQSISARNGFDEAKARLAGRETLMPGRSSGQNFPDDRMLAFGWTSADGQQSRHTELWFDGEHFVGEEVVVQAGKETAVTWQDIAPGESFRMQREDGTGTFFVFRNLGNRTYDLLFERDSGTVTSGVRCKDRYRVGEKEWAPWGGVYLCGADGKMTFQGCDPDQGLVWSPETKACIRR